MASNVMVQALSQMAYDAGVAEAKLGAFGTVPCTLLDENASALQFYLQVGDGTEWLAGAKPKSGSDYTRLLGVLSVRFASYTFLFKRAAGKTTDQLKVDSSFGAGIDLYLAGKTNAGK